MKYLPREYQKLGYDHLISERYSGLFMDMGLGKTVVILTAIKNFLEWGRVKRVLVIGTKRVANYTWPEEIAKWDHTRDMDYSCVVGMSALERKKELAKKKAITLINFENIAWLQAYYGGAWPFDYVVIDESSKIKNSASARFKALRIVRKRLKRVTIATGSPSPNGLMDIWSQIFMLDGGKRLGEMKSHYRAKYFELDRQLEGGIKLYKLRTSDNALLGEGIYEREIYSKIEDICISMNSADHITLPDKIVNYIKLTLPPEVKAEYEQFERDKVLELFYEDGEEKVITAVNAVSLSGKLLQFANGAVYDENKIEHIFHDVKLDALEEIIEENAGKPVMVAYWFQHDLRRLLKRFKNYGVRKLDKTADFNDWNKGKIPVALIHPMSGGHGLNLQFGGNTMVFFSLPNWDLDVHDQVIKRIWRPGLQGTFYLHYLLIRSSIEIDMLRAMKGKGQLQKALMNALRVRKDKYINDIL